MYSAVRVEDTSGGIRSTDPLEGGAGGSHAERLGVEGALDPVDVLVVLCVSGDLTGEPILYPWGVSLSWPVLPLQVDVGQIWDKGKI